MIVLALGVALFAVFHLALALPEANEAVRRGLGKFHGMGFGLLSLAPLALIVLGWRTAPFDPLYETPSWGRIATFMLVLLAFLCLGIYAAFFYYVYYVGQMAVIMLGRGRGFEAERPYAAAAHFRYLDFEALNAESGKLGF